MAFATSSPIPETNSNSSVKNQVIVQMYCIFTFGSFLVHFLLFSQLYPERMYLASHHDYELALDKLHLDACLEKQEIKDKV
jgi:hypothetical protein